MGLTSEQAASVANKIDEGLDGFFAVNTENKIKIVKAYLDQQIGNEPKAEIKNLKIPGIPFELSGAALETATDMVLDAVAEIIVKKWFSTKVG